MSARASVKRLAAAPLRLLPAAARRRLMQVVIEATAASEPAAALQQLLQMDDDLTGAINEVALSYGGGIHAKHRLMRYHDFFVDRIGEGQRVLDVGCGYGAVAASVAARSHAQVTGLDMSPENVALARTRFTDPDLTFVVGKAPDQVPDARFDVVIASNVLEHVEDRIGFLHEIERRVGPSRWLIRVPMIDRDWRVPLRQELGVRHFSDPTHYTEYTRQTFDAEMASAGFTVRHLQINWGEIWAEVAAGA
jgi:2-polyprenyl-3-methyl-5-hydroxy-6-metoxy-1,4-benzoquinol methylase